MTREFRPPKPDPAGILHIAVQWGLEDGGEGLIMVGDSIDDMYVVAPVSRSLVLGFSSMVFNCFCVSSWRNWKAIRFCNLL